MELAQTRYVDRDGAALAYQSFGSGSSDVVMLYDLGSHLDLLWTDPDIHHNMERIAHYARFTHFQMRGVGLSDRISYTPTIEQQASDVLAVMDAVGMQRGTLVGLLTTCSAVALVAALAPERVSGLILVGPPVAGPNAANLPADIAADLADGVRAAERVISEWGSGSSVDNWDRALATPFNRRLMALLERSSATPTAARAYFEWFKQQDFREVFKAVRVPTRVLHIPEGAISEAAVRFVADLMPNATFHVLPPTRPGASIGQSFGAIFDHLEEAVTGSAHSSEWDRYLGTLLFTDVVSSTELLSEIGDAAYRNLRADHERQVRLAVEVAGGRLVAVTGDGTLSVFDSPTVAVRTGERICQDAADLGLSVRCGIHTGELERDGMNVAGMTVHIGARVEAASRPGEVLVSRTVHDLVVGSGLSLVSRGEHELKGVPGRWELFTVEHAGEQTNTVPLEDSIQTRTDKVAIGAARRVPRLVRLGARMANAVERRRAR